MYFLLDNCGVIISTALRLPYRMKWSLAVAHFFPALENFVSLKSLDHEGMKVTAQRTLIR